MPSSKLWSMRLQGAVVGGMDCGDHTGYPVLAFHGSPGCHVEAVAFADAPAAAAGLRLVAVDRPGMGMSELAPQRQVIEWTETVAAVADHFGFDEFAVLGASGGGPYAMACAHALPDRVSSCVLVSSLAPVTDAAAADSGEGKRAGGLMILRLFPFLARPVARRLSSIVKKDRGVAAMIAQMSQADQDRIARDDQLRADITANIRTAFVPGSRGTAADMQRLFARPWGFDPADIVVPTVIWHGTRDANVPVGDGRRLAAMIPGAQMRLVEGAGHLLFVDHAAAVLDTVRQRSGERDERALPD
ncbi:alpha/beta fold hydrolase [Nocardia sp. CDC160]|uniref:alpha/beta fold hydrolase n=1 Tax=Nocardia sp. CDC160 TaxID=3112166 RepID=UPI002DB9850C|nr:alpha/beta hydrolase [Nocardia sp. CDC160]MEC3920272.1 alpha/beta hydrolase [Nocardia sp. CDC160]